MKNLKTKPAQALGDLNKKLIATILAFVLVLSVLTVGVFAATSASVSLGGTISFTSSGIYGSIAKSVQKGTLDSSGEATSLADVAGASDEITVGYDWSDTTGGFTTSTNLDFTGDAVVYVFTFTITNLAVNDTSRNIYYQIVNTAVDNIKFEVLNDGASSKEDFETVTGGPIATKKDDSATASSATIKIYVSIENPNASVASDAKYSFTINLAQEEFPKSVTIEGEKGAITLYQGTEVWSTSGDDKYWYLKMGYTDSTKTTSIRWRLASANGTSKFTGDVPTTLSNAVFVQETYTWDYPFNDVKYSYNYDYDASGMAKYLKSFENESNPYNIDTSSVIYQCIKSRSCSELAVKNAIVYYSSYCEFATDSNLSSGTESYKFWLLSLYEVGTLLDPDFTLLTGRRISSSTSKKFKFYSDTTTPTSTSYWLRTPSYDTMEYAERYVDSDGGFSITELGNSSSGYDVDGLRAAFSLSI